MEMSASLQGKVVIVTGASSGVGEAAARQFAKAGAKVVLAARSTGKIEALAREIGGLAVSTDVTRRADLEALVQATVDAFGGIDVLVNNAGFNSRGDFDTVSPEDIEAVLDTNLKAPLLLTRFALPHLRQS